MKHSLYDCRFFFHRKVSQKTKTKLVQKKSTAATAILIQLTNSWEPLTVVSASCHHKILTNMKNTKNSKPHPHFNFEFCYLEKKGTAIIADDNTMIGN